MKKNREKGDYRWVNLGTDPGDKSTEATRGIRGPDGSPRHTTT